MFQIEAEKIGGCLNIGLEEIEVTARNLEPLLGMLNKFFNSRTGEWVVRKVQKVESWLDFHLQICQECLWIACVLKTFGNSSS